MEGEEDLSQGQWIIGRGADLVWVIGSSLAGYLYLLLNVAGHVPVSLLWWFWSIGFDGTHIFGMASRTYFDAEARERQRRLLFGSVAFFFSLGPLIVLAAGKLWLAVLFAVWAYYHVLRQHYGFLMLYKVKNSDLAPGDNRMDQWFLYVMLIVPPFHRFFVHHPEELGLPRWLAAPKLDPLLWALAALVTAAYVVRQTRAFARLNVSKLLLLGGVVPLHWLAFTYLNWQAVVPTVTIVHNLQYHALIWFHNRNRYGASGRFATLTSYIGVALLFSALYRVPGFHLGRVSDLAFGFFCGFGMTHYYLDSRIWRVRHDPSLRQALGLA